MTLHALPRPLLGLLVMLVWLAGCASPGEPPTPATTPAETTFQRGVAALTRGSYDQAITAFTETLGLTPDRVEKILNSLLQRQTSREEDYALRLTDLKRKLADAEARLGRLYQAIESGIADPSDATLKDRLGAIKTERDIAQAAFYRAVS